MNSIMAFDVIPKFNLWQYAELLVLMELYKSKMDLTPFPDEA